MLKNYAMSSTDDLKTEYYYFHSIDNDPMTKRRKEEEGKSEEKS
jgi:hypothetical protein